MRSSRSEPTCSANRFSTTNRRRAPSRRPVSNSPARSSRISTTVPGLKVVRGEHEEPIDAAFKKLGRGRLLVGVRREDRAALLLETGEERLPVLAGGEIDVAEGDRFGGAVEVSS